MSNARILIYILFCLLSQCTPHQALWAHPRSPTIWTCHTGQTGDPTQASPPPSPLRRTQPRADAQKWPPSRVERLPPTPSAGATQVTAAPPGGPSSTPAVGRSRSIACTPMTSPCPVGRSGKEDSSKGQPRMAAWNRTVNPRFPQRCRDLSQTWIYQNQMWVPAGGCVFLNPLLSSWKRSEDALGQCCDDSDAFIESCTFTLQRCLVQLYEVYGLK